MYKWYAWVVFIYSALLRDPQNTIYLGYTCGIGAKALHTFLIKVDEHIIRIFPLLFCSAKSKACLTVE